MIESLLSFVTLRFVSAFHEETLITKNAKGNIDSSLIAPRR